MKRVIILFFIFSYSAVIFAKPLDIEISAPNAILISADNGRVLFEKNADHLTYPASITKMIIVWYVLEKHSKNLNNFMTASQNALKTVNSEAKIYSNYKMAPYFLEPDGSNFEIQLNEKLTLNDLLHGMVIISGNDASNVVAENLGGSIENFMRELNDCLKQKGFVNTNLCNPHGLYMPNHITTVYDVAYIIKLALNNPQFIEIFSSKFYIRPKTNKQQKKEIVTFNKLFKPGKNYYQYAICSKTGYHSKAKYNLLTVAKKQDRTLIAVVFGCPTNESRYEDTIKLFETAFAEKKITKRILEKEKIFLAKIQGGTKILKANMLDDLNIDFYPSEEKNIKAQIVWNDLKAPIIKGQKVGCMELLTNEDELLKRQNIYAASNVSRTLFFILKEFFIKK